MEEKPAKFRHVLCVYPYRAERKRSDGYWPPLGIETIAAVLEPHAEDIDVIDLRWEAGLTTDFVRPDTDLVCFSVNWGKELDFVRQQISSVPERLLTMVGGRHATQDPEKWLSDCPNVDVVVRGDGEEIVEEIAQGRPLDHIAGISYCLNGKVVHGPVRHVGSVPNNVWPSRRLRRRVYLLEHYGLCTGLTVDAIASSRGCPFNCTFCSFNRNPWGEKRSWSARSPESVVRELEEIDAKVVGFTDDNFTHDMDRVGAICDLIVARGIRKRYVAAARVEIAKRPDVLRKMERVGFSLLALGIESAQDKTLRSMRKGFDTRQLREYFRVLRRSRMLLHGYFILGNIGETEAEMLQMAPFARELGLDTLGLTTLHHLPYDGLEELVAQNPGYHIAPGGTIYSGDYPRECLRRIRHRIARDFYRPRQVLKILRKAVANEMATPSMIIRLPWFLACKALETRRRRKARRERERSAARSS